jgi:hypothetical protein
LKKGLSKAAGAATSTVSAVASAAKHGAEALAGLTAASAKLISQFANVGNDLGKAADTLAPIPIIGPALSATLGAVASAATETTNAFKTAAGSGATFGGSVNAMARSASQAGMTISDFASLIASSGEGLLAFGSTTEGGAKNFSALSKEVRSTSSDLYAMGFGTKEINEGLVAYGKQMRMQGRSGTMTNAQLAAGAKGYMKELDLLSKVTGKSRKAIEDQMAATAADGQFRAAMAGLGPDVEASANSLINSMPTPELQSFAKDLIANGTATTENSRALMAQFPQLSAQFSNLHRQTQSNVAISKEQSNQIMNIGRIEGPAALKRIKTAAAADESLHGMAASAAAFGRVNEDGIVQGMKDQENAAKATDGQVESVEKAQEALAAFSNSFQMALANSGLLDLLMDSFSFLANIVNTFVVPAFNMLSPILSKMFYGIQALAMPIIERFSGSLGGLDGTVSFIDGLMNTVFDVLGGAIRGGIVAFDGIKEGVMALFEPLKRMYESIFGVSDSTSSFGETLIKAGTFLGDVFRVLGDVLGWVIDALQPLWKLLGWVVDSFMALIDFFANFEHYRLSFLETMESLVDGMLNMLNKITFGAAGISDKEYEEREKAREEAKEDRLEAKQAAEKAQIEGLKQDKKEFENRKLGVAKLGGINDKEADVRKDALKGKEEATKNLNDPIQMLMAEAKQQGAADKFQAKGIEAAQAQLRSIKTPTAANADLLKSADALKNMAPGEVKTPPTPADALKNMAPGEVKTPPTPAASAAANAKASVEADAEKKAQEAQKAKEAAKEAAKPTPTETPKPESGPGQTSGQTAIAQLNSNIEELVRLMRINNSLTSEQSSGLSRLAGSVTGDLFQV